MTTAPKAKSDGPNPWASSQSSAGIRSHLEASLAGAEGWASLSSRVQSGMTFAGASCGCRGSFARREGHTVPVATKTFREERGAIWRASRRVSHR